MMKCRLDLICKFLENCNTEVCKHFCGELHLAEPKKSKRGRKKGYNKAEKKAVADREFDPSNDADVFIARRVLIYRSKQKKLSEDQEKLVSGFTGRHIKLFTVTERQAIVDAVKNSK